MSRRIAMIGEQASPLGGVEGGGQNVYVGQLATHLARRAGHRAYLLRKR